MTDTSRSRRMPAVFVGHGSPLNAILDNRWSRGFRALGASLPQPRAILVISAHWYVPGTWVTANELPPTIHDFAGFPQELFDIRYPAPGDRELAQRLVQLLARFDAAPRLDWGLDHGAWSVLRHLRPAADVPVVQLGIDHRLAPARHFEIGQALAPLRDAGILVLGSGNLVHDLRHALQFLGEEDAATPAWAADFDAAVAAALERRDHAYLVEALAGELGRRAHPTPEHYLPILYVAGAAGPSDTIDFPLTGFDAGSLSMRAVRFG